MINNITAANRAELGKNLNNYLPVYSGDVNPIIDIVNKLLYKSYKAIITQTGTDAPEAKVVENTLNAKVDYVRVSNGSYVAVFDKDIFPTPQQDVTINANVYLESGDTYTANAGPIFFNAIGIETTVNGSSADDVLGAAYPNVLEVKVYNS